jgi:hypothetical protein
MNKGGSRDLGPGRVFGSFSPAEKEHNMRLKKEDGKKVILEETNNAKEH